MWKHCMKNFNVSTILSDLPPWQCMKDWHNLVITALIWQEPNVHLENTNTPNLKALDTNVNIANTRVYYENSLNECDFKTKRKGNLKSTQKPCMKEFSVHVINVNSTSSAVLLIPSYLLFVFTCIVNIVSEHFLSMLKCVTNAYSFSQRASKSYWQCEYKWTIWESET